MNPNLKPATHIRRDTKIICIEGIEQKVTNYRSISAAKKAARTIDCLRVDKTKGQYPHNQPCSIGKYD